jgi:hypothetical protein
MRIKESQSFKPGLIEDMLSRPDGVGNKGIDFLTNHGVQIVHGNEQTDFGISNHGAKVVGLSKERCILFKTEPPMYNLFFGLNLQKKRYMKKFYAVMSDYIVDDFPTTHFIIPREFDLISPYFDRPREDFLCMILRNKTLGVTLNSLLPSLRKYTKFSNMKMRKDIDKFCCDKLTCKRYHSYGRGWDKRCFRGQLPGSQNLDVMSVHKFTLGIENCSIPGYVTEKMIHPMFCGSIPVYLGAPDVEKYVPKNVFIDIREYSNYNDLLNYLSGMQEEEINEYKERIKKFITSEQSKYFSSVSLAKVILYTIREKDW